MTRRCRVARRNDIEHEAGILAIEAAELDTELQGMGGGAKSQLKNVMATGVAPVGWTRVPWDAVNYPWTAPVALAARVNDVLTIAEVMRMNEAIRRAKFAVQLARDAMIRIANGKGEANDTSTFGTYFGANDDQRIQRVKDNFTVLALALERGPVVVDLRNTLYGLTCYAACFCASLATRTPLRGGRPGPLALTGRIDMFLGRAFYAPGNYEKTTDDTVGTLVHEFSHGAVNAVDVPPVDPSGSWMHARISDTPTDNDFGVSTDNSIQASTPALDALLARHKPDYAVVNADSYGQFATRLLTLSHR